VEEEVRDEILEIELAKVESNWKEVEEEVAGSH
jgi:hypothetical protein